MKWGVRNYQYADGSLTPKGEQRYRNRYKDNFKVQSKVKTAKNKLLTAVTGNQHSDGVLKKGVEFSRVQSNQNFEKFAFYATYKKKDVDKYMGLFGQNLTSRAAKDAKDAEKKAKKTGSEEDIANAKKLRDKSDNFQVYQLKISATDKLRIPSDENASHILTKMFDDKEFRDNVKYSIDDSKTKMLRPQQQILLSSAQKAMKKDVKDMSPADKKNIYKAFNLSLVYHDPKEIKAQDAYYAELKKKGYGALLDYNDKSYSSYHAKKPTIVFDLDKVKLSSVSATNPEIVAKLNNKYNRERLIKEIPASTVGTIMQYGNQKLSNYKDYVNKMTNDYLYR